MIQRVKNVFVQAARVSDVLPFYESLLGSEPLFVDGERWSQFKVGDLTVALAGEEEATGGAGAGWVLTVETSDMDGTLRAALDAGAELVEDRGMGDNGRAVILRDPAGNLVALWSPKQ
jgi:predicted enzyme related to lactoylglutathione lyase